MKDRKPNDGRPYYCHECGLGFGEYLACELPDCRLESEAEAQKRAKRRPKKKPATYPKLARWAEKILNPSVGGLPSEDGAVVSPEELLALADKEL